MAEPKDTIPSKEEAKFLVEQARRHAKEFLAATEGDAFDMEALASLSMIQSISFSADFLCPALLTDAERAELREVDEGHSRQVRASIGIADKFEPLMEVIFVNQDDVPSHLQSLRRYAKALLRGTTPAGQCKPTTRVLLRDFAAVALAVSSNLD